MQVRESFADTFRAALALSVRVPLAWPVRGIADMCVMYLKPIHIVTNVEPPTTEKHWRSQWHTERRSKGEIVRNCYSMRRSLPSDDRSCPTCREFLYAPVV